MAPILILVAAAGAASRMRGADKLLHPVQADVPLLAHVVAMAARTGQPVLVTLRTGDVARRAALDGQRAEILELADASEGLAASLRAGARAALEQRAAGLLVLPADLPDLLTSDLRAALKAWSKAPTEPLRATAADGTPGHPVILPARLLPQVMGLQGDVGARAILARNPARLLVLKGRRAVNDIDTAEDWMAWRAAARPPGI
jgi:CTP:molybdopterin cytidylyltransferase MocA